MGWPGQEFGDPQDPPPAPSLRVGLTGLTVWAWRFRSHLFFKEELKGNNSRAKSSRHFFTLFGTFSTYFHTFFQSLSEFFLQDFFLDLRGFATVLVQRDEKRPKENKKKKTKPFCTFVVARLSSSEFCNAFEVCSSDLGADMFKNHLFHGASGFWGLLLGFGGQHDLHEPLVWQCFWALVLRFAGEGNLHPLNLRVWVFKGGTTAPLFCECWLVRPVAARTHSLSSAISGYRHLYWSQPLAAQIANRDLSRVAAVLPEGALDQTDPKWPHCGSVWPYSEQDSGIRDFGPFWPAEVHFGLFGSANRAAATAESQRFPIVTIWESQSIMRGQILYTPAPPPLKIPF